ncbi:cytochrome bc complex cytochrome b subunit [Haloferax mediterranei ATCC 33500]|uniref:Cytochrome B n=1 Tax=Haloferax mediterranei (strain ATCC 33500 / DSM 1411 / JCM 8866 / NBRC 14739 / NCIMB 2177 / R-4) TaxID=523841 RepID=I3R2S3_HALMT|nr:cytochrome bc complex cytochrome b subunit [Haloferax mediterranei]AFK18533.1 menaquinol--cytochrome-c reductase (cytochrome bc complex) cytochrome b/c subunit [Haloferax mediterranei ATCC 33500]AHZ22087.1 cytochrome B [Haloferax mediterranei ATCC 33500]EMA02193.1 menaquinol--cytochrome-c reductase (cytochrome bc complex) cytochrome b/c subunit [Haloferax mediterranei ATCC 33500]MDX5988623.1 cytochrome bc complex cytochrome b subunit [Haloferax mediterranei ATCC 33500]QCQ75038.1 cytochrome 
MSNNEPENKEIRTDGTGIVAPDNETPTWSERKARKTGLSRLTYEYFERARREDQDLRTESDYVERDVLAFPTWPHETVRNLSIGAFFVGMILFLSATMPPHIGAPANPSNTPEIILPDWYLYWSFGLLKLNSLNPELAILGGQKLMADRTYGVLANGVVVGAIAIAPFLNKGSARRPVEQPFWAAVGVFGVVFALTLSLLAIKNLMPMNVDLLFDLTFLLPVVFGTVTYAVLKTMREGYMYDLNRRYYRLRPPK